MNVFKFLLPRFSIINNYKECFIPYYPSGENQFSGFLITEIKIFLYLA
jgi:hypothetical protein